MHLQGQAARCHRAAGRAGFALAALLVAIAVMSVMLLVALPTWRHLAQREKEAELVFRGEQYGRAIALYQRKLGGAFPPTIDILVEQTFLRQKYKDPITGDDFMPVYANSQAGMAAMQQTPATIASPGAGSGTGTANGIVGVVSKSKAKSIRLYNGRDRYDQWVFTYMTGQPQQAVAPGPPGQRGVGAGGQSTPGLPQSAPGRGRGRGGQ